VRLLRFELQGRTKYGVLYGGGIQCIRRSPYLVGLGGGGKALTIGNLDPGPEVYSLDEVKILAPVQPSKIICIGLNYVDHADELNLKIPEWPLIFLKPPSALSGPGDPIIHPEITQDLQVEGELAVVIGKKCRNVLPDNVMDNVLGFTCANDVTARDLQRSDGQWARAKGFDTFCPLGPWVETDLDPTGLSIKTWIGDKLIQDGNTSSMQFSIEAIIACITQVMTLNPGDVILTGTPPGVATVHPEDTIKVEIEQIGSISNTVRSI